MGISCSSDDSIRKIDIMPIVILNQPFIRHYAGSVFDLSDAIGYSDWDEDIRIRDRMPCIDHRIYHLPDNGKGIYAELPVEYTYECPKDLFKGENIKSGPCRITSVSKDLKAKDDPFYAEPLPKGKGKIVYDENTTVAKNKLLIDVIELPEPDKVKIINLVNNEEWLLNVEVMEKLTIDFSEFNPGFYNIIFYKRVEEIYSFTMIKCYPFVVTYDSELKKYTTSPTLW